MRLIYNRPAKVSKLRELDSLGMPVELRNEPVSSLHFPLVVKDDYMEVWEQFIETSASKELYSRGISPIHGNLNVAVGFISYLDLIASDTLHSVYNLKRVSDSMLNSALNQIKKLLPIWLKRRRIDKAFKLSDIDIQVDDDYNDFIGAYVDINAAVFLTFEPARKSKLVKGDFGTKLAANSLDPLLYARQRYMFGGDVPKQLKSITRNTGSERVIHKYLDLKTVKEKRTTVWHLMDAVGNMKIYAYRSGENSFTLKFTLDTPAIYLGGGMKSTKLKKLIGSKIESILKLR